MSKVVLVTGANGFIGRQVVSGFASSGSTVRAALRSIQAASIMPAGVDCVEAPDMGSMESWISVLDGVDVVVHLAGRAHQLKDAAADPLSQFRKINTYGTLRLARDAVLAKVRRFIYISSIGVNGDVTKNKPFYETDIPDPVSPYALSKWEAEQGLIQIQKETDLEVVIIRPPLVYGPGAPGNLERLMQLIYQGIPLPFGNVKNQRSLIGIDNLVDLFVICAVHPAAAGETFLVSDGLDISTSQLIQHLAGSLGCNARLWSIPVSLMRLIAASLGKSTLYNSLCGSLQIDSSKANDLLGWRSRVDVADGLARTARQYIELNRRAL